MDSFRSKFRKSCNGLGIISVIFASSTLSRRGKDPHGILFPCIVCIHFSSMLMQKRGQQRVLFDIVGTIHTNNAKLHAAMSNQAESFLFVLRSKSTARNYLHDGVNTWKRFPHHWPFYRGIWSPIDSSHKGIEMQHCNVTSVVRLFRLLCERSCCPCFDANVTSL